MSFDYAQVMVFESGDKRTNIEAEEREACVILYNENCLWTLLNKAPGKQNANNKHFIGALIQETF